MDERDLFAERERAATRWLIDTCKAGDMHLPPPRPAALEAAFAEAEAFQQRQRQQLQEAARG